MFRYPNREEAGRVLAEHLKPFSGNKEVVVLALPRGGVPVAYEIARKLQVPLDVFIVRKLGVPGHAELAMGAIAVGDVEVYNDEIIKQLQISKEAIAQVVRQEKEELKRRETVYRGNQPFPNIKNKTIILVDDGIATGATMRAAIKALRAMNPSKITIAIPVADVDTCKQMTELADGVICPLQVRDFNAVGVWYEKFDQTTDEEVHNLLQAAKESVRLSDN